MSRGAHPRSSARRALRGSNISRRVLPVGVQSGLQRRRPVHQPHADERDARSGRARRRPERCDVARMAAFEPQWSTRALRRESPRRA